MSKEQRRRERVGDAKGRKRKNQNEVKENKNPEISFFQNICSSLQHNKNYQSNQTPPPKHQKKKKNFNNNVLQQLFL